VLPAELTYVPFGQLTGGGGGAGAAVVGGGGGSVLVVVVDVVVDDVVVVVVVATNAPVLMTVSFGKWLWHHSARSIAEVALPR
jgi:hypothetical protein